MARSPNTASKSRAGGKARGRLPSKSTTGSKKGASKAAASKKGNPSKAAQMRKGKPQRNQPAQAENWASSVGSLLSTQVGREVLAEVLEAASAVLRRDRGAGQQVAEEGEAAADASSNDGPEAVSVTAEVVSGAMETGGGMAAVTAGIMQAATESLATMMTGAVRELSPEGSAKSGVGAKRKGHGRNAS